MANGSTKHGDAVHDKLAEDFMKSQEERRVALRALRDSDWEMDSSVTHVHAEPGAVVNVGATGKHQALSKSDPPSSFMPKLAKPVTSILIAVKGWPQVVALLAIAALLAYVARLKWGH